MTTLVPIPWQPTLYLTPSTLGYLEAASSHAGHELFLYNQDSAWRSYAVQEKYYDDFLHHGGPPASSPDVGPRYHMRGAAFDLVETSEHIQDVCRSVGLIRDLKETWHWNDPAWASMPVIPSLPAPAKRKAPPDMAVRLIYLPYLSKTKNIYYLGYTGTGTVANSNYTQAQANQASQVLGSATLIVKSDAELKALQVTLKSLGDTPPLP